MNIWNDILAKFKNGDMLIRLIFINVALFVLVFTVDLILAWTAKDLHNYLDQAQYFLATTHHPGILIKRPWSIITHMFFHRGLTHILFNMIGLFLFGRLFMEYFGSRKLLSTYLLGGICGFAFMFLLFYGLPGIPKAGKFALGASGAIYAVAAAVAMYHPNRTIRLMLLGEVKVMWIFLFLVGSSFFALNTDVNVGGNLAHLGGAAYGFFLARGLKEGKDIGRWFERLIDRFVNLFKKKGFKTYVNPRPVKENKKKFTDEEFNKSKAENSRKVDRILDKISKAGYESLTKEEKDFLFKQSDK